MATDQGTKGVHVKRANKLVQRAEQYPLSVAPLFQELHLEKWISKSFARKGCEALKLTVEFIRTCRTTNSCACGWSNKQFSYLVLLNTKAVERQKYHPACSMKTAENKDLRIPVFQCRYAYEPVSSMLGFMLGFRSRTPELPTASIHAHVCVF